MSHNCNTLSRKKREQTAHEGCETNLKYIHKKENRVFSTIEGFSGRAWPGDLGAARLDPNGNRPDARPPRVSPLTEPRGRRGPLLKSKKSSHFRGLPLRAEQAR